MFSDHNRVKLETNNWKTTEKSPDNWKLNNTLLNNPCIKEEDTTEIRLYFEVNENEIYIKICRMQLKQHLQGNL